MQRDGCFRGSSIMLKEKITFWAPFSCNWHRRLRVPAVDELQERVDKRKTGKHARSPAVKNTLLLPRGWKPIPKRVRDWEWERGAVAFFWQPVQCGSCEAWEHLCVSLCPPSPSSLHPSRSPFLSHTQTGAVVLSLRTYSTWPASLGVHRHSADWTSGGKLIFRAHDCVKGAS